jgi:hypothetical protein
MVPETRLVVFTLKGAACPVAENTTENNSRRMKQNIRTPLVRVVLIERLISTSGGKTIVGEGF